MTRVGFINKSQVLPKDYVPTEHLILCGNSISNYQYLIEDGGFKPILIGKGDIPRLWLFAKTPTKEVITLVEDSVSYVDQIKIDIFIAERKIEVKEMQSRKPILKVSYKDELSINYIDLRPIGYNIYGDESKLMVGSSSLSKNEFSDVKTIIGFGGAGPEKLD